MKELWVAGVEEFTIRVINWAFPCLHKLKAIKTYEITERKVFPDQNIIFHEQLCIIWQHPLQCCGSKAKPHVKKMNLERLQPSLFTSWFDTLDNNCKKNCGETVSLHKGFKIVPCSTLVLPWDWYPQAQSHYSNCQMHTNSFWIRKISKYFWEFLYHLVLPYLYVNKMTVFTIQFYKVLSVYPIGCGIRACYNECRPHLHSK